MTETKALVRSFVKRIVVRKGTAVIHCTIPTPDNSPLSGADEAEFRLREGVRSVVLFGSPRGTVLRAFAWEVVLYDLLEFRPGFLPQW